MKVGIIDYGGGNLRSVANALRSLGEDPVIIARPEDAGESTHLLLPGQGEFGDTMQRLEKRGLAAFLKDWISEDRPYFGICVGYQILFESSQESPETPGLGILPGSVRRFQDEPGLKIPHMGWNSATATRGNTRVWQGLGEDPYFYYIHSYFPEPLDSSAVVAATTHGTQKFAGAVEQGNLFACQFHPEKSQEAGLRLIRNFLSCFVALFCCFVHKANADPVPQSGMVWLAGGDFSMGNSLPGALQDETPVVKVTLDGYWIDTCDVTNAEFRKFTEATGYKTIAERPIDWEEIKKTVPPGTPKPSDEQLQPGSVTFAPQPGPINPKAEETWWTWTHGANWQHPDGPASDLKGREDHPVVHIAWEDAAAYAKWAGKRLPTEAEWEYAARGGLDGKRFAWGDEFKPDGKFRANTWTGTFPSKNTAEDGFAGTSPVKSFPANGYGLYDMGGNVWNWCADWYRVDTLARAKLATTCVNPKGPTSSYSPGHPLQQERIIRGGSFLCHAEYSEGYRPAARRGSPIDTGMSHIGFRCARNGAEPQPSDPAAK